MDPKLVRFSVVPGAVEPGGRWESPPRVADDQRATLIAAFNGGFRMNEARGGFFHDGRDARPLVDGAASFVVRGDGTADVAQWGRDGGVGPNGAFGATENLTRSPTGPLQSRAWTATTAPLGRDPGEQGVGMAPGVGVRPDGTIVRAAANGLNIVTLADLFVRAGVVRAMELDINPEWVTSNLFAPSRSRRSRSGRRDKAVTGHATPRRALLWVTSPDFFTVNLR